MSDYRSTYPALRERWLQSRHAMRQDLIAASKKASAQDPEDDCLRAVIQHALGNSEYLINYLRSDRPISPLDREHLAQALESILQRKARRGRPANRDAISAAMLAVMFYKSWRAENKRVGIKDHGDSAAMKHVAVGFVINEFEPSTRSLDARTVRELMDRPKSRRAI